MLAPARIPDFVVDINKARGEVVATCACGARYDAESWDGLPLAPGNATGIQHVPAGADAANEPAYDLELRSCPCGSTLSVRWPCGCNVRAGTHGARSSVLHDLVVASERLTHQLEDTNNKLAVLAGCIDGLRRSMGGDK